MKRDVGGANETLPTSMRCISWLSFPSYLIEMLLDASNSRCVS